MGDRHRRAMGRRSRDSDMTIELFGERLDDARAQTGCRAFRLACGFADPVVGNAEPLAWLGHIIADDNLAGGSVADKGMLEGVDDEFGDDEADAHGLIGQRHAAFRLNLQRDRTAVADHRGRVGRGPGRFHRQMNLC